MAISSDSEWRATEGIRDDMDAMSATVAEGQSAKRWARIDALNAEISRLQEECGELDQIIYPTE